MDFILCSAAFVICLAVQVSCQLPPKPIGEWHYDRAEMYPNPWVHSSACRTPAPSGLCDVNAVLNDTERMSLWQEMTKNSDADRCLSTDSCNFTVTLMKKIGPQITDYRAAAKEFADKFRAFWKLGNCTPIFIGSKVDNMCCVEEGSGMKKLLSTNVINDIEKNCSQGHFVEVIYATLFEYRKALEEQTTTASTQEITPESGAPGGSPAIIVGVIVGVLVVIIGVIIIVIIFKRKAHREKAAEVEHLKSTPKDV